MKYVVVNDENEGQNLGQRITCACCVHQVLASIF